MVDKLEQSWATVHKEYRQKGGQKKPAGKKNVEGEKLSFLDKRTEQNATFQGKKLVFSLPY